MAGASKAWKTGRLFRILWKDFETVKGIQAESTAIILSFLSARGQSPVLFRNFTAIIRQAYNYPGFKVNF
jgi:hypothetical protein